MSWKFGFLHDFTEIKSMINEEIEFRYKVDGNVPVAGSYYRFPVLKAMKKIMVEKLKIRGCCHEMGNAWRVQILLNGHPTGLHLEPSHLLGYARIIFEYNQYDDGTKVVRASGSREVSLDRISLFWRSLFVALRNWKYEKREKKYRFKEWEEVTIEIQELRENKAPKHPWNSHVGDYNWSSQNVVTHQTSTPVDAYDKARNLHVPFEYHKPSYLGASKKVTISANDRYAGIKRWDNAIVGYFVGNDSQNHNVEGFVRQQWSLCGYFETYVLKPGFFLFNFMNGVDRFKLLQQRQQFIDNIPFILKRWEPKISLNPSIFLATLPVWVRFPCLDLQFWSQTSLSKISSIIGNPLFLDEPTALKERLDYARVCIEIKLGDKLPDIVHINLENHDTIIEQAVEFEWKPRSCIYCYSFFHHSSACALTSDGDSRKTSDMDMESSNIKCPFPVLEINENYKKTASFLILGKNGSSSYYSKMKNMLLTIKRHFLA